jgi:hypothetical protein
VQQCVLIPAHKTAHSVSAGQKNAILQTWRHGVMNIEKRLYTSGIGNWDRSESSRPPEENQ